MEKFNALVIVVEKPWIRTRFGFNLPLTIYLFIYSADELLLTELIFNGVFNNLTSEQSAALVSCFVCDENTTQASATGEELRGVLRQLQVSAAVLFIVSD